MILMLLLLIGRVGLQWGAQPSDPQRRFRWTTGHSVGWADDPTCSDCHSTNHTAAHFFSRPTHATDVAPGGMWPAPLQVAQFLAGLPQFSALPHCRLILTPFHHNHHSRGWPPPLQPPAGPHFPHPILHCTRDKCMQDKCVVLNVTASSVEIQNFWVSPKGGWGSLRQETNRRPDFDST